MKLKDILKQSNVRLGEIQTDKDNPPFKTPKQIEEERLNEYAGLDKEVKKQFMQVDTSMSNIEKDILVDKTNAGHGDKPQLGKKHMQALKSVNVIRGELVKLKKLLNIR
tara:strand:- start:269 stop:595 length:327 start_codon:yes stop_codon:yes gene_type:complete